MKRRGGGPRWGRGRAKPSRASRTGRGREGGPGRSRLQLSGLEIQCDECRQCVQVDVVDAMTL